MYHNQMLRVLLPVVTKLNVEANCVVVFYVIICITYNLVANTANEAGIGQNLSFALGDLPYFLK